MTETCLWLMSPMQLSLDINCVCVVLRLLKKKQNIIMIMNTQNTLHDIEGSRVEAMVKPSAATPSQCCSGFFT